MSTSPNDCGCCQGLGASVPERIANPPGLDAVAYRVGSHARFKESLLARLSSADLPALARLRTRDDDDLSIALLDAWAVVADVLSFYQERIVNEAFLRTAVERLSVGELARLIGYRLSPGVAAETCLAFTLQEAPGDPARGPQRTVIDIGTRVQSTPGQDEQPQTFETVERIEARVAWNSMRPRLSRRHPLLPSTLHLAGLAGQLRAGDGVLFKAGGTAVFGVIGGVVTEPALDRTRVELSYLGSAATAQVRGWFNGDPPAPPLGLPIASPVGTTLSAAEIEAEATVAGVPVESVLDRLAANPQPAPQVLVLRSRAAVFGHNAPRWDTLPISLRGQEKLYEVDGDGTVTLGGTVTGAFFGKDDGSGDWASHVLADVDDGQRHLYLDQVYPSLAPGIVVLRDGDSWTVNRVNGVSEMSRSDFNLTAKVSRLTLEQDTAFDQLGIRTTTIFGQGEWLPLARLPEAPVLGLAAGGWLELDGWVDGLRVGQRLAISGCEQGRGNARVAECHVIAAVEHRLVQEGGGTRIRLEEPLAHNFVRSSVTINANVAAATHGESVIEEVLGNGDARRVFQRFTLSQAPLTHVQADTPSGRRSTLEVRVNKVLWHEVTSLLEYGPEERVFVTTTADDGRVTVLFGDGITGARLPSGQGNVRARYRKGIGRAGRVAAGRLDVLLHRPLGVNGVSNPVAAVGGDDPESRDEARRNAPLTVRTLDRVVSLQDYEDFALAFAGIAKARAAWTWNGGRRGVHLTVAGPDGCEVAPGSTLYHSLVRALQGAGDPYAAVTVVSFRPVLFRLAAHLYLDPDSLPEEVLADTEQTLRSRFGFAARALGQPVASSEVIAVLQAVSGVVAVDLDRLYRGRPRLAPRLLAAAPPDGACGTPPPAELLTLHPAAPDWLEAVS